MKKPHIDDIDETTHNDNDIEAKLIDNTDDNTKEINNKENNTSKDTLNFRKISNEKIQKTYPQIFCEIITGAIPATFGLLFIFLTETINIIFIGKYNNPALIAAIGIGTLYVNSTGYVPGAGLLGGIDTLCSQAFGNKKYKEVGINHCIGRYSVILFFVLFCIPMNFASSHVLRFIGQSVEVQELGSIYCHFMSISVFFALNFQTSLRYLQSMNIFLPGSIITLISAVIHPFWCWVFISKLGMGIIGAAITMGITQGTNFLLVSIYIHYSNPCPESYFYYCDEAVTCKYLTMYLAKALPSAVLFSADWLGFEVLTLMSSYINQDALAANVCLFNYISNLFMLQLGLSMAGTTLVGNSIGQGNKHLVKAYSQCTLIIGLIIMAITTTFTICFRDVIPTIYTGNKDVQHLFYELIGIYLFFSMVDSLQINLHGIIKGLGLQTIASIICLVVLYPFNIPMAYFLCFKLKFGVLGLWYSQMMSVFLLGGSYSVICYYVDIDEIIKECNKRYESVKIKQELKMD